MSSLVTVAFVGLFCVLASPTCGTRNGSNVRNALLPSHPPVRQLPLKRAAFHAESKHAPHRAVRVPDVLGEASSAFASSDNILRKFARNGKVTRKVLQSALLRAKKAISKLLNSKIDAQEYGSYRKSLGLLLKHVIDGLGRALSHADGFGGDKQSVTPRPNELKEHHTVHQKDKPKHHTKDAAKTIQHTKDLAKPRDHTKGAAMLIDHIHAKGLAKPKNHTKGAAKPKYHTNYPAKNIHLIHAKDVAKREHNYIPVVWEATVMVKPEELKRHPHLTPEPQTFSSHHLEKQHLPQHSQQDKINHPISPKHHHHFTNRLI